jgi:DNA-directed RNA polymerase specialized sigma24 family protein
MMTANTGAKLKVVTPRTGTALVGNRHRAAVVLRDVEGLSNKEVARVLEISLAAAKSRIHRGRMQLREELLRWEQGGSSG